MLPLKSTALVLFLFTTLAVSAAEPVPGPQAGQKVAFLGDSITAMGAGPAGYVSMVALALKNAGREIVVIPAGVGGNTSVNILARLKSSVLDKKPDWMTLSCGVNDVWHNPGGVDLESYKKNITSIVDQCTAAGIKVVILTATMICEDPSAPNNQKLAAYNDFLRGLAKERHLLLADLNADMQAEVAKRKAADPQAKGNLITIDGVHMNGYGNEMMATGILKAFGFTPDQLAAAKVKWDDLPGAMIVDVKVPLSLSDYVKLQAAAAGENRPVEQVISDDVNKDVQARLKGGSPEGAAKP